MNKQERRDMRRIASFIENLLEEKFNLNNFYGFQAYSSIELDQEIEAKYNNIPSVAFKEGFCKTTACVWGYAPTLFKRVELIPSTVTAYLDDNPKWAVTKAGIRKVHKNGFVAGARFFGISKEAAKWIFHPEKYWEDERWPTDTKAVARRLRVLARNDGKIPEETCYKAYNQDGTKNKAHFHAKCGCVWEG